MSDFTNNFNFELIDFDQSPWHDREHDNWHLVDTLLDRYITTQNVQGVWKNATLVNEGERWVDRDSDTLWEVQTTHTTASSGTFAADRTAFPSNWSGVTVNQSSVGTWTTNTPYTVNDFVIDQTGGANRYGVVVNDYTSSSSYDTDVTNGNIITLINLVITALAGIPLTLDPTGNSSLSAATDNVILFKTDSTERLRIANSVVEFSVTADLNGEKLVLTPDGLTSIHGENNGQIDIEIASADDFRFTANTFTILAGSSLVSAGTIDLDGTELILDSNGDTSITSDTDDQIDFKIGGSDLLSFLSTGQISHTGTAANDATAVMQTLVPGSTSGQAVSIRTQDTRDVTNSAKTILTYTAEGGVAFVAGKLEGAATAFLDIVAYGLDVTPTTLHSFTTSDDGGAPTTRTYTRSGSTLLQLAMGTATTYNILVYTLNINPFNG